MDRNQVSHLFLQKFLGGRFESDKQYLARIPKIEKGRIGSISLDDDIIKIVRHENDDIEITLSECSVFGSPHGEKLIFESQNERHMLTLRVL